MIVFCCVLPPSNKARDDDDDDDAPDWPLANRPTIKRCLQEGWLSPTERASAG